MEVQFTEPRTRTAPRCGSSSWCWAATSCKTLLPFQSWRSSAPTIWRLGGKKRWFGVRSPVQRETHRKSAVCKGLSICSDKPISSFFFFFSLGGGWSVGCVGLGLFGLLRSMGANLDMSRPLLGGLTFKATPTAWTSALCPTKRLANLCRAGASNKNTPQPGRL